MTPTPPPFPPPIPAVCPNCGHPPHEGGTCLYLDADPMGGLEAVDKACQCHVAARVESWWGARDAIQALDRKMDRHRDEMHARLDRQAKVQREILAALRGLGCSTCPAGNGGSGLLGDDDERPSEPPNGG